MHTLYVKYIIDIFTCCLTGFPAGCQLILTNPTHPSRTCKKSGPWHGDSRPRPLQLCGIPYFTFGMTWAMYPNLMCCITLSLRDCCVKCANRFSPNFAQAYLLGRNALCISLNKQLTLSLLLLLLLCAQSSARMPMCTPSFFPKKKPHWQTLWGTTACSYECNLLTPASPTNSKVSESFNIFNWFSKTALHLAESCFLRNRRAHQRCRRCAVCFGHRTGLAKELESNPGSGLFVSCFPKNNNSLENL